MQKLSLLIVLFACMDVRAQTDSSSNSLMQSLDKPVAPPANRPVKVFQSQKLINANTVEVLPKGFLEFKVIHNFGDIDGSNGGVSTAFGLDGATDVKIAFQLGVTKKLNVLVSRSKGGSLVQQLYELGVKYQFLQQMENDSRHPLSLTLFANGVVSTQKKNTAPDKENSYQDFNDRLSQVVQLMVARKFGPVSIQLSPTYVHTNYVVPGDVNSIFALGTGVRIPLFKRFVFIGDYFHTFRSKSSKDLLISQNAHPYDALGLGLEIVTLGHVFHMNFTNATNILENRFIPRTFTTWSKGQWRWGFTVARNFVVFRDKNKRKK